MLKKRILCAALAATLTLGMMPASMLSVSAASNQTTLTFSQNAIAETVSGVGYTISGTTLTISASGVYTIKGNCPEGSIVVSKSLENVILIFDGLSLTSSTTAPVVVKKGSNVTIHLNGTSTLTDQEDASTEETNADFEGAAIKVKSGSTVTFCGEGTLNVNGNAKNGIKGAEESAQIFNGGTFNVTAANNGIAADGSVTINAGSFTIDSENDGIKSVPDATDTVSVGEVTINGGTFDITAAGDAIQAETTLKITNGNFTIQTLGGYNDKTFDSDTMSCKGLKASGDREDIENELIITGGQFSINAADDAIHSDTNATITGGSFVIYTGDDGVHADTQLDVGVAGGYARDPQILIYSSYEGLEAGTVNILGGKYYITASDDGINAAGGSSNGSDGGQGGGDHFNPGGRPGPGGGGESQNTGNYSLNISGGAVYVDCLGDGLDSNGALNLTGGDVSVFSMQSGGDNSPLDADGTITLNGATVFAAGTNPMNDNPSSSGQSYYKQTTSLSAGTVVTVKNGSTVLYSDQLLRNINYLLYSAPGVSSSSVSVSTGGSVDTCKSHAFAHNWNNGTVVQAATATAVGKKAYTCQDCGAVEYQTIPMTVSCDCDGHTDTVIEEDEGYPVSFSTDGGATVNVYHTQDYSTVSEKNVSTTVSRNADTGLPDSTGEGQVNFRVVLKSGYELDSVSVNGSYKNLKDVSTDTLSNTYRVTKVAGALTITIATKKSAAFTNTSALSAYSVPKLTLVTISGDSENGQGDVAYAFYYKKTTSSAWTSIGTKYGTATEVSFFPSMAATYQVMVKAKDESGKIVTKIMTLTSTTPTSDDLVNTSTISKQTASKGEAIALTGKATGGTGTYNYAFYYRKTTSKAFTAVATPYSGKTKVYFKPAYAVDYIVRILVMDDAGTVAIKEYTLSVS